MLVTAHRIRKVKMSHCEDLKEERGRKEMCRDIHFALSTYTDWSLLLLRSLYAYRVVTVTCKLRDQGN